MFFKEMKEDLNKWKDNPYLWIRKLNIVKVATLPKVIYRFSTIPTKIQADPESKWECEGPRIAKTILRKNKVGGLRSISHLTAKA